MAAARTDAGAASIRGLVSRALRRAPAPEKSRRPDEDVRELSECRLREVVCVVGALDSVTGTTSGGAPVLEAVLSDGSGRITLVWLGRNSVLGVAEGRRVRARGRLAESKGYRVIYNPSYELLPEA